MGEEGWARRGRDRGGAIGGTQPAPPIPLEPVKLLPVSHGLGAHVDDLPVVLPVQTKPAHDGDGR